MAMSGARRRGSMAASVFSDLLLSPLVSLCRYESLREAVGFCADSATPSAIDAVLFIGGVDSRDDPVNAAVLTSLLIGPVTSILPPELEDVMLIVHRGGATLYTAPGGLYSIAMVTKLWPHLTIVALPGSKVTADQAFFEEHKMQSFRDMVRPHTRIGMVWAPSTRDAQRHGNRLVESWPIVQSYAFDDSGSRPFFTMEKEVVALPLDGKGSAVTDLLCPMDAHDVIQTVGETAELLTLQFEATLSWAEQSLSAVSDLPLEAAEAELRKTLDLFEEHCRLAASSEDPVLVAAWRSAAPRQRPFMSATGEALQSDVTVRCDNRNNRRRSVTLKLSHPWRPVAVARTYALHLSSPPNSNDTGGITLAALSAAAALFRSVSLEFLRTASVSTMLRADDASAADGSSTGLQAAWRGCCGSSADIGGCDASVLRRQTCSGGSLLAAFIYLEITTPGSDITLGDTFFVVVDCTATTLRSCTALTGAAYVDALRSVHNPVEDALARSCAAQADVPPSRREAVSSTSPLGKLLIDVSSADGVAVVVGRSMDVSGRSSGAVIYLCEQGILVLHKRLGVLGPCFLGDMVVHNPSDTSTAVVAEWHTPAGHELGDGVSVAVYFRASGYGRREFLNVVLPLWRRASPSPRVLGDDLPEELQQTDPFGPALWIPSGDGEPTDGGVVDEDPESESLRKDAAARLAISTAQPGLIAAAYGLHACGNDVAAGGDAASSSGGIDVLLYIVSGPIASGKHKAVSALHQRLAQQQATLHSDAGIDLRVRTVQLTLEHSLEFSSAALSVSIDALVAREASLACAARLVLAVIVQLSPNACMPAVAEAVATVNAKQAGVCHCRIVASTAIVNTDVFYGDHGMEPPALPAQGVWRAFVPGYVDLVLVLSSRYSKVSTGRVERSVRHAFGSATLPLACLHPQLAPTTVHDQTRSLLLDNLSGVPSPVTFIYSIDELAARCSSTLIQCIPDAARQSHRPVGLWGGPSLSRPELCLARAAVERAARRTSYSSITCAASVAFLPRLVKLHFDRMTLIEPDVLDFMAHLSDPPATSPFLGVIRVKGMLHVEGRPYEMTAVRYRAQLNRLRPIRIAGASGMECMRHDQSLIFFMGGDATAEDNIGAMERYVIRFVAYRGSLVGDVIIPKERLESSASRAASTTGPPRHLALRPLISREDLTDSDVAGIALDATKKGTPLLQDWVFDGEYRNLTTGAVSGQLRPDAEALAAEFIAIRNAAAIEYNQRVLGAATNE